MRVAEQNKTKKLFNLSTDITFAGMKFYEDGCLLGCSAV
jgi:hypothetical protein